MRDLVIVKLQRPLVTDGNKKDILSYIVDKNDEQVSNPIIEEMSQEDIEMLFGTHHKVYYLGEHTDGEPIQLLAKEPVWKKEWV